MIVTVLSVFLLTIVSLLTKTAAFENYTGTLLNKDSVSAVALGAGATQVFDVVLGGQTTMVVQADLTATAANDLAVVVFPYEADGATLSGAAIPAVQSGGPTLTGGHSYFYGEYDILSLDKVRVVITNNNVGAQTLTRASWELM